MQQNIKPMRTQSYETNAHHLMTRVVLDHQYIQMEIAGNKVCSCASSSYIFHA
jgi:hypothetical protein